MLGLNIFRLIEELFQILFIPFKFLRLNVAKSIGGWWSANFVNWIFIAILIILLAYWMGQAL